MKPKPTIFEFTSYEFLPNEKRLILNYRQDFSNQESIFWREIIELPGVPNISLISKDLLEKILQSIHLVCGTSYHKFYCATKVKISYRFSKQEVDFWNKIYKNGLGEFYYRNKLNPQKSPKFSFDKNAKINTYELEKNNRCLLGFSGGKDSIVAAELLKEKGIETTAFFVETQRESELINDVAKISGLNLIKIRRILDSQISDLHLFNGHVPVSAIYAFIGVLYAVLYNYSFYIVANEHSSNFGNIRYCRENINHQWSKSFEFEELFSNYLKNIISPDIKYFSLLRPFYEIRIAELFSRQKKYFSSFSSCNKNFITTKIENSGLWCCHCPKCVFTFTLLSIFLPKRELMQIFKKNLYQDEELLPIFKDILGLGKMKPFDCVGTFEESRLAFKIAAKKFKKDFIIKCLAPKIKIKKSDNEKLFKTHPNGIPDQFKFLGIKNVLILGYGREGVVSKEYIKKFYPKLKIGILDGKSSRNYLKKQKEYDIAIKTPGIKKELLEIPYTTATNIFLSEVSKLGNLIIGVTGSKGKSTTASLIYSILLQSGKKVKLLGNIGNPVLSALLSPVRKNEIFVLEMSSYQLDDVKFSPNIAVITNLFPEHMDYHSGIKNYYQAKKNIIDFQQSKDLFVYNQNNKTLCQWAKSSRARIVPFVSNSDIYGINFSLPGEHNNDNLRAAVAVAKELGINDQTIKRAVEGFKPLPHRLEFIGEFKGIKFYDDAVSTTPESTIAAIKSLPEVDTIFLGGQDRGYDFSGLEKAIRGTKIKNIVLFPDSGDRILKSKKGFKILKTKDMKLAVNFAYKNTKQGGICLLSCASPSYSLWKNFEEKGDQFKLNVIRFNEKTH